MPFKPEQYLGIRLWGQQLLSFDYYIKDQQNRAAAQQAPIDALYYSHGSPARPEGWVCVSDLKPDHDFRASYAAYLGGGRRQMATSDVNTFRTLTLIANIQASLEFLINSTPSGTVRNRLTEINMEVMALAGEIRQEDVKEHGLAVRALPTGD